MKKLFFLLVVSFCISHSFAQDCPNPKYYETRGYLKGQGYTIVEDKFANLMQGETTYFYRKFYEGTQYKVYGFSDDGDVKDLDLYIYYSDGSEYTKDTQTDAEPIVTFTPSYTREMKIVLKNYNSDTPKYASKCHFFVAYK